MPTTLRLRGLAFDAFTIFVEESDACLDPGEECPDEPRFPGRREGAVVTVDPGAERAAWRRLRAMAAILRPAIRCRTPPVAWGLRFQRTDRWRARVPGQRVACRPQRLRRARASVRMSPLRRPPRPRSMSTANPAQ